MMMPVEKQGLDILMDKMLCLDDKRYHDLVYNLKEKIHYLNVDGDYYMMSPESIYAFFLNTLNLLIGEDENG